MLDRNFTPSALSAAVLKPPLVEQGRVTRGAIILNHVDDAVRLLPDLRRFFFIVERRGWHGLAHSIVADIKLVEDLSTLEQTRREYPRAILLPLSNADFVDTDAFHPLDVAPEYDVVSIACWSPRKRLDLLIRAAAKLPRLRFVHLASFNAGGTREELAHRDRCLRLASETGARIDIPFADRDCNADLPWTKEAINAWINKAQIGVLTATQEGHNRFKMECMAADRPVLVARDAGSTTHKHINSRTGASFHPSPDGLSAAIVEMLEQRELFRPREHLLAHSGRLHSLAQLQAALREACKRAQQPYHFDDIDWDGRNERFTWGEAAYARLRDALGEYRRQLQG